MNSIHDDVGDDVCHGVDHDVGDVFCDIFKKFKYIFQIK
jgi:hypothetical protein